MNKTLKKGIILLGVFLAAVGIYFVISIRRTEEPSETLYTSMEEPVLPTVYADVLGTEENRLAGYRQEMDPAAAGLVLTVLPEDRALPVRIETYGCSVLGLQYEIRSLDRQRLVERTRLEGWTAGEDQIDVTLPIQNLIAPGTEYQLDLQVETEAYGTVHYYTRILQQEEDYASAMLAFARDFSRKTFSEEEARSLTTYMEPSGTADDSSLGHVTIESSFSQLTWAGLEMEPAGQMQVTLRELDGIMGQAEVSYQVCRESEGGETETYDVTDCYTMKWGASRIYLMGFDRTVNQVFSGGRDLYSGRRILLGIGNDDAVQVEKSPDGRYAAFVFNRDLWRYDQEEHRSLKVFSFRSGSDVTGRSDYGQHQVRILSMGDDGNLDFLVYGYMNRGPHEGQQGISLYRCSRNGALEERFFVPSSASCEELRREMEILSCLGENGLLYLYLDHAVYGIDLSSNEYMVVAEGLEEGNFFVSSDKSRLAWQEGEDPYSAGVIHVFDMNTGAKQELRAPEGSVVQALGFVQEDFVYGLARQSDLWVMNGRVRGLPMYALEIVNPRLEVQTRYEREGYYLFQVTVDEARVHMDRLVQLGGQVYAYRDSDTIVCNEASEETYMEGVGWYASEVRRKLYFVQLDQEVPSGRTVGVSAARNITYDHSEVLELTGSGRKPEAEFYAYGSGRLRGVFGSFPEAVEAAYPYMGIVTDENRQTLWDRVDRDTARTLSDAQATAARMLQAAQEPEGPAAEELRILDGRGCTLQQVLYFIGRGCPVIAYGENGEELVLYGYDQYNVSVLSRQTGESYKMGLNDASGYFDACGNDFICAVENTR